MYNLKHLFKVAYAGLSDMAPAVQQAFNDNHDDDNLKEVFGQNPRHRIVGLTLAGIVLGEVITWLFPALIVDNYIINEYVNWSAVVIGMGFALLFRQYLFNSGSAKPDDFPWLAASLIPAAALIAIIAFVRQFFEGSLEFIDGAPIWAGLGTILIAMVNALGVVAALSIAVAALCFSRDWIKALVDLAVQLLVFKIMVWVTVLVVVDIGFVGTILANIIESAFGFRFPSWLADLVDQLTLVGLLLIAYGALIGGVWTVCKQQFGALLDSGEVRILKAVNALAKQPKKKKDKKTAASNDSDARKD
ncbi:MAG: hypothetical protein AB8G18_12805 [Gammaproteobacteria bacterium]